MTDPPDDSPALRFLSCGDTALVVEFGNRIDRSLNARVLAFDSALQDSRPDGMIETVPTFRSVMIHYDPLQTSQAALIEQVRPLAERARPIEREGRSWTVPVCYEDELAPDLKEVSERTGLSPDEVIQRHGEPTYHVYMMGFVPGFPYLGALPEALVLPRREDPRVRVPAGAVGIASAMTAIYPVVSPGGWHLIGSCPWPLFDAEADPPSLFLPGDRIRFQIVPRFRYDEIAAAVRAGPRRPQPDGAPGSSGLEAQSETAS